MPILETGATMIRAASPIRVHHNADEVREAPESDKNAAFCGRRTIRKDAEIRCLCRACRNESHREIDHITEVPLLSPTYGVTTN
jgi:hypothetical protein